MKEKREMNSKDRGVLLVILSVFVVGFATANSRARMITVDNDAPADFSNIQAAIDDANDGDTVVVAPGVYTGPGNRDMDYLGKAIVVRSQEGPSLTIIDCEGAGRAFYFHSGEDHDSVLEGFTITNGSHGEHGGAIFAVSSSPTVNRCAFVDNFSGWKGGAIHASATQMMLTNCLFWRNEADFGGAVHQSAVYGSGASLINCTVVDNYAHNRHGGGRVYCGSNGTVVVANCIVWDNKCDCDPAVSEETKQLKLPRPVISYSCVQGWTGSLGGPGNWADDPLLDATDGLAMRPSSPCFNAGDPSFLAGPEDLDIDGEKRVAFERVDMGADEYQPPVIYVDGRAEGANSGSSWTSAYNHLQDALAEAKSAYKPAEIRVAQGTYRPDQTTMHPDGTGDRYATFLLIEGVTVKGGYAGLGRPDPDARDTELYETVLSGDLNRDDGHDFANNGENSLNIVTASGPDSTAVLDGFTITAGNANINGDPTNRGGGIFINSGSPTLTHCVFRRNMAGHRGGGMYITGSASPMLTNCIFSENRTPHGGCGLDNAAGSPTLIDCTFSNNYHTSDFGGGVGMCNAGGSPILTRCTFINNSSLHARGGAMQSEGGSPVLTDCLFSGNSARWGAGIYYSGTPSVVGCTFVDNSTTDEGGAILSFRGAGEFRNCIVSGNSGARGGGIHNYNSTTALTNCVFVANTALTYGGAIENWNGSDPLITNCTFTRNHAEQNGGAIANYHSSNAMLTNCIAWGNTAARGNEIFLAYYAENKASSITVGYSDIEGGQLGVEVETGAALIWGQGNLDENPLLAPDGYHISQNSPCINTGDPEFTPGPDETDIDGENRVMLGRIDIGADEFNPFLVEFFVVRKERVGRTVFEYECELILQNVSTLTLDNISLEMANWSKNMTIDDPIISFGDVEIKPGESITSVDTCTFTVDRSKPIDPAEIIWHVAAESADTGAKMRHTLSTALPPEPTTGFDGLKSLAEKWLWQGKAGEIGLDTVEDGTVNLADFAIFAEQWFQK